MIAHRRYLEFRTERLEKKNRWLTILASVATLILLVAITAGPALVRIASDAAMTDASSQVGQPVADPSKD